MRIARIAHAWSLHATQTHASCEHGCESLHHVKTAPTKLNMPNRPVLLPEDWPFDERTSGSFEVFRTWAVRKIVGALCHSFVNGLAKGLSSPDGQRRAKHALWLGFVQT